MPLGTNPRREVTKVTRPGGKEGYVAFLPDMPSVGFQGKTKDVAEAELDRFLERLRRREADSAVQVTVRVPKGRKLEVGWVYGLIPEARVTR